MAQPVSVVKKTDRRMRNPLQAGADAHALGFRMLNFGSKSRVNAEDGESRKPRL